MKYKIHDHAKAFLEENLPEALNAESSFEALKLLYELIDEKGLEAPKYDERNDFGMLADEFYDEIYGLNMQG